MNRLFLTILNMNITASIVIAAVLVLRLLLKKAPAIYSYLLWAVVFIRLVCPFSLETDFGLIPSLKVDQWVKREPIPVMEIKHEFLPQETGEVQAGTEKSAGGEAVFLSPEGAAAVKDGSGQKKVSREPEKIIAAVGWIWLTAGCLLILYQGLNYRRIMKKMKRITENGTRESTGGKNGQGKITVTEGNSIRIPFVTGMIRPVIWLPEGMEEKQRQLVMAHELIHIKRKDNVIKPFAFFLCCVHWFNPLVWIAYHFMEQDMESSCDEEVLRKIGYGRKKEYAYALLQAAGREGPERSWGIAFGENGVKGRIRRVMKMKKKKIGISILAAAAVLTAAGFLLVNAPDKKEETAVELSTYQPDTDRENVKEPGREEAGEKIPGTGSNEGTDEVYMPKGIDGKQTDGEAEEEGQKNEEILTEYVPAGDVFETLLYSPSKDQSFTDEAISYSYPVKNTRISQTYGVRVHPVTQEETVHSGFDFAAEEGTEVTAAADGTVLKTGTDESCGNYILLQHDNGDITYYACCREILREEGERVARGEQIAAVGNTGISTGAHLHFAVSRNGSFIEPEFTE